MGVGCRYVLSQCNGGRSKITASLSINNQKLKREKLLFVILISSECYIVLYDLKSRHLGSVNHFSELNIFNSVDEVQF